MVKIMRIVLLLLAATSLAVASLEAQQPTASFRELTGKVEVQKPGGQWAPATVGMTVSRDTIISTGFKSVAVLRIGESSLTIRPLTRLALEAIAQAEGSEQVKLYLLAGRVRAEVKAPAGGSTDFTVRSPSATASVRGTSFDFDAVNLEVGGGLVSFSGNNGSAVFVGAGEASFITESGGSVPPAIAAVVAGAPPPVAGTDPTLVLPPTAVAPTIAPPNRPVTPPPARPTLKDLISGLAWYLDQYPGPDGTLAGPGLEWYLDPVTLGGQLAGPGLGWQPGSVATGGSLAGPGLGWYLVPVSGGGQVHGPETVWMPASIPGVAITTGLDWYLQGQTSSTVATLSMDWIQADLSAVSAYTGFEWLAPDDQGYNLYTGLRWYFPDSSTKTLQAEFTW